MQAHGAMGMTEPSAGTDVLGMTTTAVRSGDHFIVNGTKTYITNGVEGFCFLVYAKVDGRLTAFVIDRDCPGFTTSNHIDKLGMRGSTMSELIFEDCRVPAENLLGELGSGLTHMMRNLEIERLTLAAMSVGIAERCVEIMVRHAHERQAFRTSLNRFGQIQRYIASRLGDPVQAEDVCADVFVKVLESLARYEDRGWPFSAWLYRIAYARTMDMLRQARRRGDRLRRASGGIGLGVEHLALQVAGVDDVVVDDRDRLGPGRHQAEQGRAAEPAGPQHQVVAARAGAHGRSSPSAVKYSSSEK